MEALGVSVLMRSMDCMGWDCGKSIKRGWGRSLAMPDLWWVIALRFDSGMTCARNRPLKIFFFLDLFNISKTLPI